MTAPTHWLARKIEDLQGLESDHGRAKAWGNARRQTEIREALLESVRRLVQDMAAREGVTASFASYDGLLVDAAGGSANFDALAAMGQRLLSTANAAADPLLLSGVQQLVVIGASRKVVLFQIGDLTLGILGPAGSALAESLA